MIAAIENSPGSISASQIDVSATYNGQINNITVAGAAAGTFALGGAVSINNIRNTTDAYILGSTDISTTEPGAQSFAITASDTATIEVLAGGVGLAIATETPVGIAAGVSVAVNKINDTVVAYVAGSQITSAGDVDVTATATPTVKALTIGVAVGVTAGGGGFAGSGAGAGSGNTVNNTVQSYVSGSRGAGDEPGVSAGGAVTVSATDTPTVDAVAGALSVGVAVGGAAGVGGSVGISVSVNDVEDTVEAFINDSTVTATGHDVTVQAIENGTINAWTIGGAVGAGDGGGVGVGVGAAGAGSGNTIKNHLFALIEGNSTVTTLGGDVMVSASDSSSIEAIAGGLGVGVGVGALAGGAGSLGVAAANNDIENTATADVDGSSVTSAGMVDLSATETATILTVTVGGAVSVGVGGEVGVGVAVAGSVSTNTIKNQVGAAFSGAGANSTNTVANTIKSYITGKSSSVPSVTSAAGDIGLTASENLSSSAVVGSGAAAGAVIGGSVGVSLGQDTDSSMVAAYVDNAQVTSTGGQLSIGAVSTDTANALSVATSLAAALGGAGAGANATVDVSPNVEAYAGSGATLKAGEAIALTATSANSAKGVTYGIAAAGIAAVGASTTTASANGSVQAHVDGVVTNCASLAVEAAATDSADAESTAIAVGLVAGSGDHITGAARPDVLAYLGHGAHVTAAGAVDLSAASTPTVTAVNHGGGGGVSVSALITDATIGGRTWAFIDQGASVTADLVSVRAITPSRSVNATSYVVNIALGAGTGTSATSEVGGSVEAFVGRPGSYTFDATSAVDKTSHFITLGATPLKTGDAVVYGNGGGTSIGVLNSDGTTGTLTSGTVYYAIVDENHPSQVELADSKADAQGGTALALLPVSGSSSIQSLTPSPTSAPQVILASKTPGPFEFDIKHAVAPSLIDILQDPGTTPKDLNLTGTIENAIGTTVIQNTNGNIANTVGSGQVIRTNILDVEATGSGSVGSSGNSVNAQLVQSTDTSTTPAGLRTPRLTATSTSGDVDLDLRARNRTLTPTALTVYAPTVSAGGNINLTLESSVVDTATGSTGAIHVTDQADPSLTGDYAAHFHDATQTANASYDLGVYGTTTNDTTTASTYDFTGTVGLSAGGNINVQAANPGSSDPTINIIGDTTLLPYTTTPNHIDVTTNGFITLTELTGDLRVGTITSTDDDVTLYSPQAIVDAVGHGVGTDANVTGINITMTAGTAGATGGIGLPTDFLEINVNVQHGTGAKLGVLTAIDIAALSTDGIFLTDVPRGPDMADLLGAETSNDLEVGLVITTGDVSLATASGSIVDARDGGTGGDTANVFGNTIDLYADGGNVGDPSGGNDLEIDSHAFAPGTIGARATGNIDLTQTTGNARVVLLQSLTGNVRFTVRQNGNLGEDLNLLAKGFVLFLENALETVAHGLINAVLGTVLLRVGDNVTTDANAQVLAGQNIDIYGDFGQVNELSGGVAETDPPHPGYGTVMHLAGVLAHGPTAGGHLTRVFGNGEADQIDFDQTFLGGTNPLVPGGSGQTISDTVGALSDYAGGRTRAYGSNTPTPAAGAAPAGDGEDSFTVNHLQTMYPDLPGGTLMSDGETLTLDGQAGSDAYVINAAGSQHGANNYVINVLDTGAPDDGVDTIAVNGADGTQNGIDPPTGLDYAADDIFLLRRMISTPLETSDQPAFVGVLHTTLGQARGSQIAGAPLGDVQAGSFPVERINYDRASNGRLIVNGLGGNDYFASDDASVVTTLDGGAGDDAFQIGQLYGTRRDAADGNLAATDVFATVATTRGWLSRGNSAPMVAESGSGDDTFVVYSNQAPLRLEGDDGNDQFTVRAFALADTADGTEGATKTYLDGRVTQTATFQDGIWWRTFDPNDPANDVALPALTSGFSTAAQTDVRTGGGDNQVQYNINAPVSVDGVAGFNKLVVLGTEFADHIVVTDKAIYGAGLPVTYTNIQVIEIDALEGDDTIDVLSTAPGVVTRVVGGLGSDVVNVAGDVVSEDVNGTSGTVNHLATSSDPSYSGLVAPSVDYSVAQATRGAVLIDESGGFTDVSETGAGAGGTSDTYTVLLAQKPTANVYVTVSAATNPQEEEDNVDGRGAGDSVLLASGVALPGSPNYFRHITANGVPTDLKQRAVVLVFTPDDWDQPQTVDVGAGNDTPGEVVTQSDDSTQVTLGDRTTHTPGPGDSYTLRLTMQPTANVNVAVVTDGQADVSPLGALTMQAVGGSSTVRLFNGDFTIAGNTITRANLSARGSFLTEGFAAGQLIKIGGTNTASDGTYHIASVSSDGQSMRLTTARRGPPFRAA